MANKSNLKSWKPGQSGNPRGKPKGTVHLSTMIRKLMEDDQYVIMPLNGSPRREAPIKAIIATLIERALQGDLKAFELLAKYGYGTNLKVIDQTETLPVPILSAITVERIGD